MIFDDNFRKEVDGKEPEEKNDSHSEKNDGSMDALLKGKIKPSKI